MKEILKIITLIGILLLDHQQGFILELVDINTVINVNRNHIHGPENPLIIDRDTRVLEMAVDYLKNR